MIDRLFSNPAALSALSTGDIANAIIAATPGGIESQEKAGQALLVASELMPKELNPSREVFEKVGFKFGSDADDIFLNASLPENWKRQASDHSMWSYIVDERGRRRVSIFYKAAFYDRRAHARLEHRFGPWSDYSKKPVPVGVADCDTMIWTAGNYPEPYTSWARDALDNAVSAWLAEHYPDWINPLAYWDLP